MQLVSRHTLKSVIIYFTIIKIKKLVTVLDVFYRMKLLTHLLMQWYFQVSKIDNLIYFFNPRKTVRKLPSRLSLISIQHSSNIRPRPARLLYYNHCSCTWLWLTDIRFVTSFFICLKSHGLPCASLPTLLSWNDHMFFLCSLFTRQVWDDDHHNSVLT